MKANKRMLYLSGAPRVSTTVHAQMGGPKSHILGIINSFKKKGWEVDEFIYGNSFESQFNGKNSDKMLKSNLFYRIIADFYRIFIGIINQIKIRKEFSANGGKFIIYERLAAFQHLGKSLKKNSEAIWIVEVNGILFLEGKKDRKGLVLSSVCKFFEKSTYKHCDKIITVSEELKTLIIQHFQVNKDKVLVIPNGVDIDRFNPDNYKLKKGLENYTIGFVGTLINWCGLDLLFEAIHELPIEVRPMVVVAGDGIARDHFEQKRKNLKLEDSVCFLGQQPWEKIPSIIAGFDVCYSGQIETRSGKMYHSPLKIYEYLAMGKPVIASAFADAKKVIKDEKMGLLFSSGDKESLKKAILNVKNTIDTYGFEGEYIRSEIVKNHSWDQRVDIIIDRVIHNNLV